MTPLWPTNDTRRQPWQTFAPPLHIWPLLLSQTTLVKQDDQRSENQDLCPRKRGAFSHNSDFCNRKLTLTDFSRLFSALVRRRHGRMPTFFHLWPYFHLSQFFPSQFGGKEKLIFVTYSEPCTPGTSIFSCDFQKGRRNRSFWHIPWCTPAQGYCPLSHCQCTFQFWLGGHTIFLFGWFCTNTSPAHIAICIFQRHISLCYSNLEFVISKYFFD